MSNEIPLHYFSECVQVHSLYRGCAIQKVPHWDDDNRHKWVSRVQPADGGAVSMFGRTLSELKSFIDKVLDKPSVRPDKLLTRYEDWLIRYVTYQVTGFRPDHWLVTNLGERRALLERVHKRVDVFDHEDMAYLNVEAWEDDGPNHLFQVLVHRQHGVMAIFDDEYTYFMRPEETERRLKALGAQLQEAYEKVVDV